MCRPRQRQRLTNSVSIQTEAQAFNFQHTDVDDLQKLRSHIYIPIKHWRTPLDQTRLSAGNRSYSIFNAMSPLPIPDGTQLAQESQDVTRWSIDVPIISSAAYQTTDKMIYDEYISKSARFCDIREDFRKLFPSAVCVPTQWGTFWEGLWTFLKWVAIGFMGLLALAMVLCACESISEQWRDYKRKAGKDAEQDVQLGAYDAVPTADNANGGAARDTGVTPPTTHQMAQGAGNSA